VVLSRSCSPCGLVAARIAGPITRADQRELVRFVTLAIARFGRVKVLIWLERYTGPYHEGRFDPDGLWSGSDADGISKVAIVGEPAWKTIPPITDRYRRVPIEYFTTEQAARCWLERVSVPAPGGLPHAARSMKPRISR
jgi:hypothetical protein